MISFPPNITPFPLHFTSNGHIKHFLDSLLNGVSATEKVSKFGTFCIYKIIMSVFSWIMPLRALPWDNLQHFMAMEILIVIPPFHQDSTLIFLLSNHMKGGLSYFCGFSIQLFCYSEMPGLPLSLPWGLFFVDSVKWVILSGCARTNVPFPQLFLFN